MVKVSLILTHYQHLTDGRTRRLWLNHYHHRGDWKCETWRRWIIHYFLAYSCRNFSHITDISFRTYTFGCCSLQLYSHYFHVSHLPFPALSCLAIVKTARNKAESAESNSSSSALKSEDRKFDRFALFRMVCNLFASSALMNPRQEGLRACIYARRVARATSHSAGPLSVAFKRFQSIERCSCFGRIGCYWRLCQGQWSGQLWLDWDQDVGLTYCTKGYLTWEMGD